MRKRKRCRRAAATWPHGAAIALLRVASAIAAAPPSDCFPGGKEIYSFDLCCPSLWGKAGNERCWDGADYTFERCCVFHPGGGNERYLPALSLEEIQIAPARPGGLSLRIRQDLSPASWDEQIPGLLFKQAYAMLRWLEAMPDEVFRSRTALELGAGIGLLSLHAAGRGGLVTASDGSLRALQAARANAEANLPPEVAWNRLTWRQLRWGDAQSAAQVRLAGLSPPYEVVICCALLYAPLPQLRLLLRLLWLCTDERSEILWGSGFVRDFAERWALLTQCFEAVEEIDAVAAGYTVLEGSSVARLRRRAAPLGLEAPCG